MAALRAHFLHVPCINTDKRCSMAARSSPAGKDLCSVRASCRPLQSARARCRVHPLLLRARTTHVAHSKALEISILEWGKVEKFCPKDTIAPPLFRWNGGKQVKCDQPSTYKYFHRTLVSKRYRIATCPVPFGALLASPAAPKSRLFVRPRTRMRPRHATTYFFN